MLTIQSKKYSFLLHYFFFLLLQSILASCGGIRHDLIPEPNLLLRKLPDEQSEAYLQLTQMLNEVGKKKLEKIINKITTVDELSGFIDDSLQTRKAYMDLIKWLPKYEGLQLQKELKAVADPKEVKSLIDQSSSGLKVIQSANLTHQCFYKDLLQVLPENQSMELKTEVSKCNNQHELDQLISSKLPQQLKVLDDKAKQDLITSPTTERQSILVNAMQKEGLPTNTLPILNQSNHIMASVTQNRLSATDKSVQEGAPVENVDMPEDGWGAKLPLQGDERKAFLKLVVAFALSDQKELKNLFDDIHAVSIKNFLYVYNKHFSIEEQSDLLQTIIYLYKGWPKTTIQLCNDPDSLSFCRKMTIFNRTQPYQRALLTALGDYLSNYI